MWSNLLLHLTLLTGYSLALSTLVQLTGKPILKGKVFSSGYSLPAKSLGQCMDACNAHLPTCDGVVYHEMIGKCRMVNKCSAAIQVDNSSAVVYFSKRPLITEVGYVHIPETDTCVGLISKKMSYAEAERDCSARRGRLISIKSLRANKASSNLLRRANLDWAWVGENQSGNYVKGAADFTPDVIPAKNMATSLGLCWAINVSGQWTQYPCKDTKLSTICEIPPFPA